MSDVTTARTSDEPAAPATEAGWEKAPRGPGKRMRTCLPAVLERDARPEAWAGPEGNIVRGED